MFTPTNIASLTRPLHRPAFLGRLLVSSGVQLREQTKPNPNFRAECIDTAAETPKLSKRQAKKRRQLLHRMQIYPATGDSVSPFMKEKYEREARKYWDLFYKRNENRFFKDRHYLQKEWGHLLQPCADARADVSIEIASTAESRTLEDQLKSTDADTFEKSQSFERSKDNECESAGTLGLSHKRVVVEVGCGVGNTVYPLLEENPATFVYACDFSPRAVDLVKAHPSYSPQRVHAFVADITNDDLTMEVPAGSADIVSMIFVLSAISPEKMPAALYNVASVLKTGGHVLVRDYAEGDLAQERLTGKIQKLGDNFYVRGDGTRAYYFSEKALLALFADAGLECTDVRMHEREFENRARKVVMNRRWIQGTFRKTAGAVGSAAAPSEPSIDGFSQQLAGSIVREPQSLRNGKDESCGRPEMEFGQSYPTAVSDVCLSDERRGEAEENDGVNALRGAAEGTSVNAPVRTGEGKSLNALVENDETEGVNAPVKNGEVNGVHAPVETGILDGVNAPVENEETDGVNAPGEDGPPSLGELFSAPLEYELRELAVVGRTVRYKALASEHQHTQPSTGLLLWESARVLAAYLSERPQILAGRRVLEVGCGGIALPSILFAAATAGVTATDGDAAAMALLEANVALNSDAVDLSKLRTERLRWGDQEDIARVHSLGGPRGYDVIIGADVVYVREAVPLLFQTAAALLAADGDVGAPQADVMLTPPLLLLCHVIRRVSEGDILKAAKQAGFEHHAVIELGELGEGANGAVRLLALWRTNGAM